MHSNKNYRKEINSLQDWLHSCTATKATKSKSILSKSGCTDAQQQKLQKQNQFSPRVVSRLHSYKKLINSLQGWLHCCTATETIKSQSILSKLDTQLHSYKNYINENNSLQEWLHGCTATNARKSKSILSKSGCTVAQLKNYKKIINPLQEW